MVIHANGHPGTPLPTDTPVTAAALLSSYGELGQPATRRQLGQLAEVSACPPEKQALRALADDADRYAAEILEKRITVLDLLSRYPSCQLTFASYLQMLAPLTPRQYSISSSPRWSADHATLTLAVLSAPRTPGTGLRGGRLDLPGARPAGQQGRGHGPPSNVAFHPPPRCGRRSCWPAPAPAGPFRGFLQTARWPRRSG